MRFFPLTAGFLLCLLTMPTLAAEWETPRTEYGHPDFQGYWSNRTQTPIQRPKELGHQKTYTAAKALEMEEAIRDADRVKYTAIDPNREAPEAGTLILQSADLNFIDNRIDVLNVKGEYRTSMIVDPPDGRFPFVEGARGKDIFGQWRSQGLDALDGPEGRPAGERCLSRGIPPMTVPPYNANFQFVQTSDYVMIFGEMVHDARIVRLNAEHHPGNSKSWLGDSVGYFDGNALVVHTKNIRAEISHFRLFSTDQLTFTERFEMLNDNEIYYRFTVTDPEIYSQSVTEELSLKRRNPGELLFEYACHEGNYSLPGILAGARRQEVDNSTFQGSSSN
ncbi:MAG: hypothetical protein JKY98_03180 [Gammaproteobacteria bacterium]|nr:hypothetical protein [Gammaproteobacteria bacterium]